MIPGNIFHSNSVGIPSIRFISLKVIVFRIPNYFALPSRNRIISNFPYTEHRVGEHVGFGVGDLLSFFTQ